MATISATWTENQTGVDFDDTTPADTVTATASLDLAASGYDVVLAIVKIDFDAGASDYADIFVYPDANSGSYPATSAIYSRRVLVADGDTQYIPIMLENIPFADIAVENQSNAEMDELDLVYCGRTWTST